MGCASSKEKVCRNCQAPYIPVRRSHSMHVHHPPYNTRDTHHLVALTSSTLGSLKLDPLIQNHVRDDKHEAKEPLIQSHRTIEDKALIGKGETNKEKLTKVEFGMGMIEAKTWSKMINERIPKIVPKTPITTPPGEPEMINAWEMMEGLEDISPLRPVHHFRSFSFNLPYNSSLSSIDDQPTPRVKENGNASPKPLWLDLADTDSNSNSNSNDMSIVSEFDPDVIATFRKSLEDLPPANPFYLKSLSTGEKQPALASKDCALETTDEKNVDKVVLGNNVVPRGTDKLIVYFTSLRGVRKTYEDCCHVQVILKGLRVKVDERDVSMHSRFKDELKELLTERGIIGVSLPRVFLGRTYVGGADDIRRLNEDGKLEKLVESCELLVDNDRGGYGNGKVCEACGDIRFVPCETCSGSCKIYYEGDFDDEEFDENEHEYGFHRCPDCNENGLILCPMCCDSSV